MNAAITETASASSPTPATLWALFVAFNRLALQGFGGVLAVAQRELVERLGWLTNEEFLETLSIAQVLPGPNVVNLSLMIGDRFFGFRGAFVALGGMLVLPFCLVIGMAAMYGQLATHAVVGNALRGMGAVSAGLILATGVKLLPALRRNPVGPAAGLLLAAFSVLAILGLHLPLPLLVLGLGGIGMALAWRGLKR